MKNKKVAIIGGGVTGLVAARNLAQEGFKVVIFEKNEAIGGLASSVSIEGEPIEAAYHHFFKTDQDLLSLINELGLSKKLEWFESSVSIFVQGKFWPFMSPRDLLNFSPCGFVDRIRTGLTALHLKKTKSWEQYRSLSALEWMTRKCGQSSADSIWGPLLKGKFGKDFSHISMAWLWARLHVRVNSRENQSAELLGYLNGGTRCFLEALSADLIKKGVVFRLGAKVEPFRQEGEQWGIATQDSVEERFDAVLVAAPDSVYHYLSQDCDQGSLASQKTKYLNAVCLLFSSEQELGEYYWNNINEANAPFLVFIKHTEMVPKERYGGKQVYYIGAYCDDRDVNWSETDELIKERWYHYLKHLFPDFDRSIISEEKLTRFSKAQHVVDASYHDSIPLHHPSDDGRFLYHFSQIYPEDRGVNYAVREGGKASNEISEYLK